MNKPVADGVVIANLIEFAADFADAAAYFGCQSIVVTKNESLHQIAFISKEFRCFFC